MNNCELSDWENITISTDLNNPTVMPYDGVLLATTSNSAPYVIDILDENNQMILYSVGGGDWGDTFTIPFNKGDRIRVREGTPIYQKVRYYKKRDYSNR